MSFIALKISAFLFFIRRERKVLLCLFLGVLSFSLFAQAPDLRKLELDGEVKYGARVIPGAEVNIYENDKFSSKVFADQKGGFVLLLELNRTYRIEITAEGMITKRFVSISLVSAFLI